MRIKPSSNHVDFELNLVIEYEKEKMEKLEDIVFGKSLEELLSTFKPTIKNGKEQENLFQKLCYNPIFGVLSSIFSFIPILELLDSTSLVCKLFYVSIINNFFNFHLSSEDYSLLFGDTDFIDYPTRKIKHSFFYKLIQTNSFDPSYDNFQPILLAMKLGRSEYCYFQIAEKLFKNSFFSSLPKSGFNNNKILDFSKNNYFILDELIDFGDFKLFQYVLSQIQSKIDKEFKKKREAIDAKYEKRRRRSDYDTDEEEEFEEEIEQLKDSFFWCSEEYNFLLTQSIDKVDNKDGLRIMEMILEDKSVQESNLRKNIVQTCSNGCLDGLKLIIKHVPRVTNNFPFSECFEEAIMYEHVNFIDYFLSDEKFSQLDPLNFKHNILFIFSSPRIIDDSKNARKILQRILKDKRVQTKLNVHQLTQCIASILQNGYYSIVKVFLEFKFIRKMIIQSKTLKEQIINGFVETGKSSFISFFFIKIHPTTELLNFASKNAKERGKIKVEQFIESLKEKIEEKRNRKQKTKKGNSRRRKKRERNRPKHVHNKR